MAFFIGLVSMYLLAWLLSFTGISPLLEDANFRGVLAASIMFVLIGIAHFAKPGKIEALIPQSWPYKRAMNYLSGLAEVVLGIAILFQQVRTEAAWGLILLLIVVFPVNIAVARKQPNGYTISRLFFQPVYIAWIWWFCIR